MRVAMGGHSIEDNVVAKRYMKIISNIEKVLMLVESLALYDNQTMLVVVLLY